MSDRILMAGATVPMLCGMCALVLMQRVPGVRMPGGGPRAAAAAARATTDARRAPTKPWVGVVIATHTAELASDTPARVTRVFVRTGARVRAGDPLVQFDASQSQTAVGMANAQLSQRVSEESRAQVRVEAAERQLERLRTGATWLSEQELDQAKTEARMASADLQSARAAVGVGRAQLQQQVLQSKRRTLSAPFAGTVVELGIDPGDSVTPGQLLMRVLSDEREVRFAAPAEELPTQGSAGRVLIKLSGSDVVVAAEISALRPELDPSAQLVFASVPLPGVLPQPERFMPGAPVQVFLAP